MLLGKINSFVLFLLRHNLGNIFEQSSAVLSIFLFLMSVCSRNANGSGTPAILAGRMIILGQRSDGRSHLPVGFPRFEAL